MATGRVWLCQGVTPEHPVGQEFEVKLRYPGREVLHDSGGVVGTPLEWIVQPGVIRLEVSFVPGRLAGARAGSTVHVATVQPDKDTYVATGSGCPEPLPTSQ
jgi:hypothetical protein